VQEVKLGLSAHHIGAKYKEFMKKHPTGEMRIKRCFLLVSWTSLRLLMFMGMERLAGMSLLPMPMNTLFANKKHITNVLMFIVKILVVGPFNGLLVKFYPILT
jgi:hypothetical protein